MSAPDLSVIVPVRDGQRYLAEAISSVLAHADGLFEVIVVDDGSTDRSGAIAREFGGCVRVLSLPPSGVSAARNRGIEAARGTVLGFLDADDRWVAGDPDPRRAVLGVEGVDAVLGRVQPVAGDPPRPFGPALSGVQPGALLVRRDVLIGQGGFDAGLRFSEDLDLILRMRDAGLRIELLDDVVVEYRQHEGSATRDRQADRAGIVRAVKASLARRDHR